MENLFEYYNENEYMHFKYAKGEPAVKDREFHDYYEFVFFIEGSSYFISKDIQQKLTPGSLVIIPKEQFHQFVVSSPESYVRCILGFKKIPAFSSLTDEVMTKIKVINSSDNRIKDIFNELSEYAKSEASTEEKMLLAQAEIIRLLVYLKHFTEREVNKNINISPCVRNAITYIDENYMKPLSVEIIANEIYVSPSTLAHKFSRELNIPIYRYISKKRLSEAHKRIKDGEGAAVAASKCGFSDYSCFYRLYKKYY